MDIRTPFVVLHNFHHAAMTDLQQNARLVRVPIPVVSGVQSIAKITGVAQSGRPYIHVLENEEVFVGFDSFIDYLVTTRAYQTRHARRTCQQRLRVNLNGFHASLAQWADKISGWADTYMGTVALIHNDDQVPQYSHERFQALVSSLHRTVVPRRVLRLSEPPMQNLPTIPQSILNNLMQIPIPTTVVAHDSNEDDVLMVAESDSSDESNDDDDMPPLEEIVEGMHWNELHQQLDNGIHNVITHIQDHVVALIDGLHPDDITAWENAENARLGRGSTTDCEEEQDCSCSICCEELTKELKAPCGHLSHRICSNCLARHATNWSCHCVSANSPYVSCPHEGCDGRYPIDIIAKYISKDDLERLEERIQHYAARQHVKYSCPSCGFINHVPSNLVKDRSPGTLAVQCQAPGCGREYCYHCLGPTPAGSSARSQTLLGLLHPTCTACQRTDLPPRNGEFNRYVPKTTMPKSVGLLPRNYELTVQDCINQLTYIATDAMMTTKCRVSNVALHRTTACLEVTHFGLRQCTVCGMSGLEFETNLIDHWHGSGRFGCCPRWMTDRFWKNTITCPPEMCCREGVCHSDHSDCHDPAHEDYRKQVVEVRRLRHFQSLLQSLPPPLQSLVIEEILKIARPNPVMELLSRIRLAREYGQLV